MHRICQAVLPKQRSEFLAYPVKFLGVSAAHQLPQPQDVKDTDVAHAFVVNTKTKDSAGEHWVLFWLPVKERGARPFLFDSFGRTPQEMGHPDWGFWLNQCAHTLYDGANSWERQTTPVQQIDTNICGHLCALFLAHVSRGLKFHYGLRDLSPDVVISTLNSLMS